MGEINNQKLYFANPQKLIKPCTGGFGGYFSKIVNLFSVGKFDLFSFYWYDDPNEKSKFICNHFFPKNRDFFNLFFDSRDYLSFSEHQPFEYEEIIFHDDSEKNKKVVSVKKGFTKEPKIKKVKPQVYSCISDNEVKELCFILDEINNNKANNYVFINCRKTIEILLKFLIRLDGRFVDIQKLEKLTPGEKLYSKEFQDFYPKSILDKFEQIIKVGNKAAHDKDFIYDENVAISTVEMTNECFQWIRHTYPFLDNSIKYYESNKNNL